MILIKYHMFIHLNMHTKLVIIPDNPNNYIVKSQNSKWIVYFMHVKLL